MTTPDFDILDFSTTELSREGVKMPFCDEHGEPVSYQGAGDDAPRELHLVLLGPEAPETRRVFAQMQHRARRQGATHSPSDEEIEAERVADSNALARLVVGGLLYSKGAWIDVDRTNAGDFLYAVGSLRAQAIAQVTNAGKYQARRARKAA